MREIKFRAWNKRTNQFGRVCDLIDLLAFAHKDPEAIDELIYLDFAQFTGLKDKNGKEIYEGDIVKGKYSNNGIIKYGDGLIDASDYEAYAIPIHGFYIDNGRIDSQRVSDWPTGTPYSLAECHEDIEVIGNIYENPELLKERNSV